jgi:hypothetical protein
MWIIDAIRAGLVEARMDQLQQKMIVRYAVVDVVRRRICALPLPIAAV